MEPIQQRELPRGELLNSVEMAKQDLHVEAGRTQRGVWGVAMWEDVDPQIDFFSVYVGGLTNAYQWTDPPGAFKLGDRPGKGRKFTRKTLQLNFWRPGDDIGPERAGNPLRRRPRAGRPLRLGRRRCLPLGLPVKSRDSDIAGCRL